MAKNRAGANTGAAVDDLRGDIVETRGDLGDTVEALSDKTDVKTRARQTAEQARERAQETAEQARERAQEAAEQARVKAQETAGQVRESVRRRPGRWATTAGLVVAAAAVATMRWRRARQTPKRRAQRAWRTVADKFSR